MIRQNEHIEVLEAPEVPVAVALDDFLVSDDDEEKEEPKPKDPTQENQQEPELPTDQNFAVGKKSKEFYWVKHRQQRTGKKLGVGTVYVSSLVYTSAECLYRSMNTNEPELILVMCMVPYALPLALVNSSRGLFKGSLNKVGLRTKRNHSNEQN